MIRRNTGEPWNIWRIATNLGGESHVPKATDIVVKLHSALYVGLSSDPAEELLVGYADTVLSLAEALGEAAKHMKSRPHAMRKEDPRDKYRREFVGLEARAADEAHNRYDVLWYIIRGALRTREREEALDRWVELRSADVTLGGALRTKLEIRWEPSSPTLRAELRALRRVTAKKKPAKKRAPKRGKTAKR